MSTKTIHNPCHEELTSVGYFDRGGSYVVEMDGHADPAGGRHHPAAPADGASVSHDSLHMENEAEIAGKPAKFEHILSAGATDKICTFLGHPTTCPHGAPIPRRPCCGASLYNNTRKSRHRSMAKTARRVLGYLNSGLGGLTVLKGSLIGCSGCGLHLLQGRYRSIALRVEVCGDCGRTILWVQRSIWSKLGGGNVCDCCNTANRVVSRTRSHKGLKIRFVGVMNLVRRPRAGVSEQEGRRDRTEATVS